MTGALLKREVTYVVGAVIDATGLAISPGNPKQLIAVRGRTYAESLVDIYLDAGIDTIAVVTGEHDYLLRKALDNTTAVCLKNNGYEYSSFMESVRIGIQYLADRCDRIFVSPLETALTDEKTLLSMLSKHADVVCSVRNGADCSPYLLSDKAFRWCMLYNGRRGMEGAVRSLEKASSASFVRVEPEEVRDRTKEAGMRKSALFIPAYRPVINWI